MAPLSAGGGRSLRGGLIGAAFSGWLTYLQAAVIEAWCRWCVASAVLIGSAFVAALPELGRIGTEWGGNR